MGRVERVDACLGGGSCESSSEASPGGSVRLQFCDLTAPFDSPANSHLQAAVSAARIITLCYVVHENALALEDSDQLGGALPGLLSAVRVGAVVVALDASGKLWPALVRSAEAVAPACWLGWALHA